MLPEPSKYSEFPPRELIAPLISGAINSLGGNSLYFDGSGNIVLDATSNNSSQMVKLGTGTLTYGIAPATLYTNPISIVDGTFDLNATGKIGAGAFTLE